MRLTRTVVELQPTSLSMCADGCERRNAREGPEMTTAKKRNLFEEIREGLEAYRDRRDTLPRRKLSASDV
jgi:hypothetical protein